MIFGVREKKSVLGQFSSEKCTSCKKSKKYLFQRVTKYIVVLFINLIPLTTRYESECINCENIIKIDENAGKKLARHKFNVENGNVSFAIALKLFLAVAIIVAAVVLPIVLIGPPVSPQMLKGLVTEDGVTEDGVYKIVNKDNVTLGVVTSLEGEVTLSYYNDISNYTSGGNRYKLHKHYEEIITENGSYMQPVFDDFGILYDNNRAKLQRYYYDIAKGTYGFAIGVKDLGTVEYYDNKSVYPITFIYSTTAEYNYKYIIFENDDWEIDVRYAILEDGSEEIIDIMLSVLKDGRPVQETMYEPAAADGSLLYLGGLTSQSSGQEFYDYITANELTVTSFSTYAYYGDTDVIISTVTTEYDPYGNESTTEENFSVVKKYNYYILNEMK